MYHCYLHSFQDLLALLELSVIMLDGRIKYKIDGKYIKYYISAKYTNLANVIVLI